MQYRNDNKTGNSLSILGYGCMRFPRGITGQIDLAKSEELILNAVNHGINYYDTAYVYGGSEETLGAILHKNNLRKKIFIATKLPISICKNREDFDRYFNEQLKRLKTDYIDYYLMHNLSDTKLWARLCGLGIKEWIKAKRESGQIRQLGFSFHGARDQFLELLDLYDWDFCQIQYNYVNTDYQAGTAGLKRAAEKKLPVIIMEPLLGGALANNLPKKAQKVFKDADSSLSSAQWGLKWLWNQPEITVVLSGMNAAGQLNENIKVADVSVPGCVSKADDEVYKSALKAFREAYKIPCTGCAYCMPCPSKVNIPGCFAAYNMSYAVGFMGAFSQYLTGTGATDPEKNYSPSRCKKCGKCETHCPQHIKIMDSLQDVKKRMEPFWYKAFISIFTGMRNRRPKEK